MFWQHKLGPLKALTLFFLLQTMFLHPWTHEDVETIQLDDIKKSPPNKTPSPSQTQHSIIPVNWPRRKQNIQWLRILYQWATKPESISWSTPISIKTQGIKAEVRNLQFQSSRHLHRRIIQYFKRGALEIWYCTNFWYLKMEAKYFLQWFYMLYLSLSLFFFFKDAQLKCVFYLGWF